MMLRSVVFASSLALTARGFLVPASMSPAVAGGSENLHVSVIDPANQVFKLDCPGCPFGHLSSKDVPNALIIKFSVDQSAPEVLNVNGVQLYPPPFAMLEPITAPQVQSSVSLVDFKAAEAEGDETSFPSVRLGYRVTIKPVHGAAAAAAEAKIMSLEFTVLSVEDKAVDGLSTLKATFFTTPEKKLMIAKVEEEEQTSSMDPAASPSQKEKAGEEKECTVLPLLCKWKSIIANKLHKAKSAFRGGCHKMRLHLIRIKGHHRHHHHHSHVKGAKVDGVPHPQDHHEGQVSHHFHHVHRHSFTHTVRRVLHHVFVPIFVGVAAGMTACIIGMVVGQVVVLVWRRLYRGKKGSYISLPQGNESSKGLEEEKGFTDGDDLPGYEDVAVVHIVDEEKE